MPLMRKRAVEMSRVIQASAFPRQASATSTSASVAGTEPQASTTGAGASPGTRGKRTRPVISSDEESDIEAETAPTLSPTDDIAAPPSPPRPQLISMEPRALSSLDDEDD
ncbi:hypothetical protein SNE40_022886 [Patella caerulea]|uniref:Uncharacterized protein n=1 Tax=Patella caerulea TaxID=87958 RepID=A0AAN8GBG9_PATCE